MIMVSNQTKTLEEMSMQCHALDKVPSSTLVFLRHAAENQFSESSALPAHLVQSMLKALRMNSEEARLKFPRLLQIIESYPSETMDLMTKQVCAAARVPRMGTPHWVLPPRLGFLWSTIKSCAYVLVVYGGSILFSCADDVGSLLDADQLDQSNGGLVGQARSRGCAALHRADCKVLPPSAGLRFDDQQREL